MADVTDPSMKVRIEGDSTPLEKTLKDAEKKVDASGKSMGSAVEKNLTDVANKLGSKIAKMIGAGFAIKALDDSLKIIAEGIKHGKGADEIALAIGDSILEGLRRVPIAGALGEILAIAFDPIFGSPEEQKKAAEKFRASQLRERERLKGLEELEAVGASPEKRAELEMRKKLREIDEKAEKALSTIQRITVFDEAAYKNAVAKEAQKIKAEQEAKGPQVFGYVPIAATAKGRVQREMFETQQFAEGDLARHQEVIEARRLAKERVEAEYQREMEKLAGKGSAKAGAPAALPDMDIPEVDVEEAVEDMHESIVQQGNESVFSDTRMIGLATDTLSELREVRKAIDRFTTANVGLR